MDLENNGSTEKTALEKGVEKIAKYKISYDSFMAKRAIGLRNITDRLFISFLCGGNILLEGAPGLGKTSLSKRYADFFGLSFSRIQFTPDLMPLDIIGSNVLETRQEGTKSFTFFKGPIFANVVLGDEINRATPKTQSAFLEAMEEKHVTFLGETYTLPDPFFVIATQNPIELEGTYPLPEAQIDRFMMKLRFPSPDFDATKKIIASVEDALSGTQDNSPNPPETARDAVAAFKSIEKSVEMPDEVKNFAVRLCVETQPERSEVQSVRSYVRWGASPRAAISLVRGAKAKAVVDGRGHVSIDDVKDLFRDTVEHRLTLSYDALAEGIGTETVISAILNETERRYGLAR